MITLTLNDELIFNEFRNQIIDNFLEIFRPIAGVFLLIFIIILIALFSIFVNRRKKFPNKKNTTFGLLLFFSLFFIIPVCIFFIWQFGLKVCYEKYLDTHPNELNWNISIETVYYKEEEYGGRYHGYDYYLYFNRVKNYKNKIKVKEYIFDNVKEGEEMYVVRDSKNKIILVYNIKDYKYVKDEQLKDN